MHFSALTTLIGAAAILLVSGVQSAFIAQHAQPVDCSSLATRLSSKLKTQNCAITSSILVAANTTTPQYCSVVAKIAYPGKNTLNFNVYLPVASKWTGRFMAVGNGGFAGTIDISAMSTNLKLGFAVAGGDAGHLAVGNSGDNLPFMHDRDQTKAWIRNAISLFTPSAKTLIHAFYGRPASYSYYNGCSTGGAQGFALAQFHPDLFDGIYAGSPGNYYSHLMISFIWNAVKSKGPALIPENKLNAITAAVLDSCDSLDGVADGMLENPQKCKFDINKLACSVVGSNASTCLTNSQLASAKAVYAGPTSSDGTYLYSGFSLSSESRWNPEVKGTLAKLYGQAVMANLVFHNSSWSYLDFNFDSDIKTVLEKAGNQIDEIGPNFSAFKRSGGKMIVTQGWTDPLNAAGWPIELLQRMKKSMGHVSSFFELFMVPGGGHCGPAIPNSPGNYLVNDQLIAWVERRKQPVSVTSVGTNAAGAAISRLLCPWPKTASYKKGDINSSTSYVCSL